MIIRIKANKKKLTEPLGKPLGFLGGSEDKQSAAMRKTWVQSLGLEDPLEKEMAIHASILAWRITSTEPGGATVHGVAKSRTRLSD